MRLSRGGDPRVIERTVAAAAAQGIAVGAHPGYPDPVGCGRRELAASPEEVRSDVLYQLGALDGFCRIYGIKVQHVKPHGALSNRAVRDPDIANAIVTAAKEYDPMLLVFAMPGSALEAAAEDAGQPIVLEGYADRAYNPDGSLVSRRLPNALMTDPRMAVAWMIRLVAEQKLEAIDGTELDLPVESICIHSDTPGPVALPVAIRQSFAEKGVRVRPPREKRAGGSRR